ncbi:hypothetical protein OH77DRAFT_1419207 [Trametes cingulata]|nr:hypothetical protein OH77DRAFT_1419207 [Trametes cingulata]
MPLEEVSASFNNLLQHCGHSITSLYMGRCTTHAFSPEQLRGALAMLPQLQELALEGLTADHRDVLAQVNPHLRSLSLAIGDCPWFPDAGLDERLHPDPSPFLRYHHSSLTALCLSNVRLADQGPSYPNVRRLVLRDFSPAEDETGWIGPLVHLFPSAEHVELGWLWTPRLGHPFAPLDIQSDSDAAMMHQWRANGRRWQAEHGTWVGGLRFLQVPSMQELYCLGLSESCPIDRLRIMHLDASYELTEAALGDARVRSLALLIQSHEDLLHHVAFFLHAVAHTASLTRLVVEIGNTVVLSSGITQVLDTLCGHLRDRLAPISHLRVFFHVRDLDRPPNNDPCTLVLPMRSRRPRWIAPELPRVGTDKFGDHPGACWLFKLPDIVGSATASENTDLRFVLVEVEECCWKGWEKREDVLSGEEREVSRQTSRWVQVDEAHMRDVLVKEGLDRLD